MAKSYDNMTREERQAYCRKANALYRARFLERHPGRHAETCRAWRKRRAERKAKLLASVKQPLVREKL